MYGESDYFDTVRHPNMPPEIDHNFSFEGHQKTTDEAKATINDLQNQMNFDLDPEFNAQIIQEVLEGGHHHHFVSSVPPLTASAAAVLPSWDGTEIHDAALHQQQQNDLTNLNSNAYATSLNSSFTSTPDFLNFLQIPRCTIPTVLPATPTIPFSGLNNKKSSPSFPNSLDLYGELNSNDTINSAPTVLYDPLQLSFQPNPPLLRDLFQSLPQSYPLTNSKSGAFNSFGLAHEEEAAGGLIGVEGGQINGRQFGNSVLDFRRDMHCGMGKGEGRGSHGLFATEKQRRESLNEKYKALKSLVPNPTKSDRASIVGDAIDYIKELLRTVEELRLLVVKKRQSGGRKSKKQKLVGDHRHGDKQTDVLLDVPDTSAPPNNIPHFPDPAEDDSGKPPEKEKTFNGSLRSSWLQRTSKDGTWVDVRIVDDEVTIKLVQKKRRNSLLFVSRILDDLQLQILHVNGAHVSDHNVFLFNTKIYEGSCIYASAIANKLIEGVDKQYSKFSAEIYLIA